MNISKLPPSKEQELMDLLRELVTAMGGRETVAAGLEIKPAALSKRLCHTEKGHYLDLLQHFLPIIQAAPGGQRFKVFRWLNREVGYAPPIEIRSGTPGDDVMDSFTLVVSAMGDLARALFTAKEPDSEMGRDISPGESKVLEEKYAVMLSACEGFKATYESETKFHPTNGAGGGDAQALS